MCGRYAIDDGVNHAITAFVQATGQDFRDWDPWTSWNIKPTQRIPVLLETLGEGGEVERRVEKARWSLVPPWAPELKLRFPTFNARSEGIAEKRTWRGPLKGSRVLIPAAGYYEWRTASDGVKTPHWIHLDRPLFFAGLYSWWRLKGDGESEWTLTATILTRPSTGPVAELHDRAPLILPADAQADWLDPGTTGSQSLVDAMVAASTPSIEALEFHPVHPLHGDGPDLIKPL